MPRAAGKTVQVTGIQSVIRSLERIRDGSIPTIQRALEIAGDRILAKARKYCPKDTGALRASGRREVVNAGTGPTTLRVHITFGGRLDGRTKEFKGTVYAGQVVYYAVYVHERTDAVRYTTAGTGPKFLERAVRELIDVIPEEIGRALSQLVSADRNVAEAAGVTPGRVNYGRMKLPPGNP
jgi:hypothetical protein